MTNTRIPELAFGVGGYRIALNPGETLFPGLVALFGAYYYIDTRGLPDRSVLYAHPLLFVTLALAVVVVGLHAIDVEPTETEPAASRTNAETGVEDGTDGEMGRGVSAVDAAEEGAESEDERTGADPYFNRYSAAGLVVASVAYFQLVQLLGFLVPSVAFCGVVLYMFGERSPLALLGYSVGFSLVVYAVFGYWLNVPIRPFVVPI